MLCLYYVDIFVVCLALCLKPFSFSQSRRAPWLSALPRPLHIIVITIFNLQTNFITYYIHSLCLNLY